MGGGMKSQARYEYIRSRFYRSKEAKRNAVRKRSYSFEIPGSSRSRGAENSIDESVVEDFSDFMRDELKHGKLRDKKSLYAGLSSFAKDHMIKRISYNQMISTLPDSLYSKAKRLVLRGSENLTPAEGMRQEYAEI